MTLTKINKKIMSKLEERAISPSLKHFLREILEFERGTIDQEQPPYKQFYEIRLNKHIKAATIVQAEESDAS